MAGPQATLRRAQDHTLGSLMTQNRGSGPGAFQLPYAGQSPDSIERWVKTEAAPGVIVVVRHARWHLYEYHLDEVAKLNLRAGRVYLAQHGRFSLHGTGISGPKGSLTLLEPTPAVVGAAIHGKTWQHGKPAFKRPLSAREIELVRALAEQERLRPDGTES
jgi:hypothetical protein